MQFSRFNRVLQRKRRHWSAYLRDEVSVISFAFIDESFSFFCYARSKRKTIIFGSRIKKKHWKTPRDRKGLNRILDLWKKTLSIMSKYFETVDWKFDPNKIRNVIRIYRWQNDPSWLYLYNVDHRGKLSQHWKENN